MVFGRRKTAGGPVGGTCGEVGRERERETERQREREKAIVEKLN